MTDVITIKVYRDKGTEQIRVRLEGENNFAGVLDTGADDSVDGFPDEAEWLRKEILNFVARKIDFDRVVRIVKA